MSCIKNNAFISGESGVVSEDKLTFSVIEVVNDAVKIGFHLLVGRSKQF